MHQRLRLARMAVVLLVTLLPAAVLSACGGGGTGPHAAGCTPPAGGRCAADVAWPGRMLVSPRGRLLHGIVMCGGVLHVVAQTPSRVTVRLHVGAMGPGSMSCALVDVGAHLASPLAGRPVYDAVSGHRLRVVVGGRCHGLTLRCSGSTLRQ